MTALGAQRRGVRIPQYPRRLWGLVFGIPAGAVGLLFLLCVIMTLKPGLFGRLTPGCGLGRFIVFTVAGR